MPRCRPACAALVLSCLPAFAAQAAVVLSPAECEVWARELGFAASVAAHDAAAFAEHVDPGAVFGAGRERQARGREAVVARWAGIVAGRDATIVWYPERTTVGGAPGIAWSEGPSLVIAHPGTDAETFTLGRFHSVWRRGEDGAWRVLYDDGVDLGPATPAQVEAFRAGRRDACPARAADGALTTP